MTSNYSNNRPLASDKFLSVSEDHHLLQILSHDLSRDALILSLLRQYGMRTNELLSLRKRDVFCDTKSIYIRGSKGSLDRELPLGIIHFRRLIEEVAKCSGLEEFVFKITDRRLRQIWDEHYKPGPNKGLHSLRHTCAIRLYEKTRDIKIVQRVLGHKYLTSTLVYQEYFHSQDELRRVLVG